MYIYPSVKDSESNISVDFKKQPVFLYVLMPPEYRPQQNYRFIKEYYEHFPFNPLATTI